MAAETPKEIRKKKRSDKRAANAAKRAERLKNSKKEEKSSTYNTSTLDPNASVDYNAINKAMFK